ncbi:MAG: FAD-binding protein, partial [Hyphomicrobiales bacterium]|nr:FAD-binding protein [Hyphomicrobiales bacterium]
PEATTALKAALAARFGNSYSDAPSVREQHAHTLTYIPNQPPDAVVFARDEADVVAAVTICAAHGAPMIAFGTGTSLEGQVNAPHGGVAIDVSGLDGIEAVDAADFDCVVGPGVTRKALNARLKDDGLFFPVDPGADASVGGMVSTRASGTNAVRYGTMRENALALRVVLADGSVLKTSTRARKSSAGYDLTRLFVGAEGTLGIVTQVTLKLHPLPEAIAGGVCPFQTVRAACDAAIMAIQAGVPLARVELVDAVQMRANRLHSGIDLPESPALFVEFHGTEAGVAEQVARFGEIAAEFGGADFRWATKPEDRTRLWQARHDSYWASLLLRPGAKPLATDACVPLSRLADCVEETMADIEACGFVAPIVGHVGDGNFHTSPMAMPDDPAEIAAVKAFADRLAHRAIAMGGTCTGEHGVGQGKRAFLVDEHGAEAVAAMRAIKAALDPRDLMNPGKMLPD